MTSKLSNKFPIPEHFPEILHDFAKEVVRAQPSDIFEFAIQYFKNLEKGNNGNNLERGYSNKSELLNESADLGAKSKSEDNMNKYDIVSEGEREKNEESGMYKTNSTQRGFVIKKFVDDVFTKSKDFGEVRQDENDDNESERRDVEESEENEGVKGNEEEIAKEFVSDILKKSGGNIMKENETDNVEESESEGVKGNEDEIAKMFVGDILKKSGENINDMMKGVDNEGEEVSESKDEENVNENKSQSQEQNYSNEEEEYQNEENEQNEEEN